MIRKRFFTKAGLYSVLFPRAEDKELWLRGLKAECRYANLTEALVEYNTNGYVRSWKLIFDQAWSNFHLVSLYGIRFGYLLSILLLANDVALKYKLRVPRSMRG